MTASASQVTITQNQITGHLAYPILLYQGWVASFAGGDPSLLPPLPAPHYLISNNYISALTGYYNGGTSLIPRRFSLGLAACR